MAAYEHAIRLAPKEPCAYTGKGFVLLEIHRFGEALAAFEQALQLAQALGYLPYAGWRANMQRANTLFVPSQLSTVFLSHILARQRMLYAASPFLLTPWSRSIVVRYGTV